MRKPFLITFLLVGTFFIGTEVFAQSNAGLVPASFNLRSACVPGTTAGLGDLAGCIKGLYQFGVSAVAILAVAVIIWGGFVWLTSGGNVSRIESAKEWINGAVFGLILALSSFILLNTINPQLVRIDQLSIPNPAAINDISVDQVCCQIDPDDTPASEHTVSTALAGADCSGLTTPKQTATFISNGDCSWNLHQQVCSSASPCHPTICYLNTFYGTYHNLKCETSGAFERCVLPAAQANQATCTQIIPI